MRALRIVHAIEKNRLFTGSVVQMMEAAGGQVGRGHAVVVAGPGGGDLEGECARVGATHLEVAFRGPVDAASAAALRRCCRHFRPHLIHVHKGRAHAAALIAATGLGKHPLVVVNRGVTFPLDLFNRLKYRHPRVAAVVCVAEAVRGVVLRSGRLPPDRVVTVHGGTDCRRFDPAHVDRAAVRRRLALPLEATVVTSVSLRRWKGWPDLLTAARRVDPGLPLELVLVGGDGTDDQGEVAAAAADLGLRLHLLPFHRDLHRLLGASDIVVDASTAGTGITGTVREAMALERAVVVTACGGNTELVEAERTGLVVPPGRPCLLADAVAALARDRGLRRRLGRAARRRVLEGFTTEHRVARLEALYRRLLAGRNGSAGTASGS